MAKLAQTSDNRDNAGLTDPGPRGGPLGAENEMPDGGDSTRSLNSQAAVGTLPGSARTTDKCQSDDLASHTQTISSIERPTFSIKQAAGLFALAILARRFYRSLNS